VPGARARREIITWGAVTVPLAVLVLVWVGTGWLVALGLGALGLLLLGVVWVASWTVGMPAAEAELDDDDAPSEYVGR
jgi:hypothetical protein